MEDPVRGQTPQAPVGVRIARDEAELRIAVKKAGGIWRPRQKLWEMPWNAVRTFGIGNPVLTG